MSLELALYLADVLTNLSQFGVVVSLLAAIVAGILTIPIVDGTWKNGSLKWPAAVVVMSIIVGFFSMLVPEQATMRQIVAIQVLRSDPVVKAGEKILKRLEKAIDLKAEEE